MFRILTILTLLYVTSFPGLTQDIVFTQLTKNYTNCVMTDQDHFVWIGTQDGLLRFDSDEFKTFRYRQGDATSLSNNFVWELTDDQSGRIWIGTFGGGLAMYDKYTEQFNTYYCEEPTPQFLKSNTIRTLHNSGDTLLWIGTEEGVYGFDLMTLTFRTGEMWDALKNNQWFVYSIYSDENGVFVATENGLYQVISEKSSFVINQISIGHEQNLTSTDLVSHQFGFFVATENGLFVAPSTSELVFQNHFETYHQEPVRVHHIFIDSDDEMWLGTEGGIAHFSDGRQYEWYRSSSTNGLASDIIHYISEVEPGILMAATRQGLHRFSGRPSLFRNLNKIYESTTCSKIALGMTEDKDGNIWICSRGGLMKVQVDSEINNWTGECFQPENSRGMLDAYTINITEDLDHNLWVAYRYQGFSRATPSGDQLLWKNFPKTVSLFNGEGINQIYQDQQGEFWIATRGFGLMHFFPDQDSVVTYGEDQGLSHPYIFRIFEDHDQTMWVATANGGLCSFDRSTKQFDCYVHHRGDSKSLSSNMVLSIAEDKSDRLWVCTVDGLNVFEPGTGKFETYSMLDGLPNDVVYAAIEDQYENTWVSTNEGIVRISFKEDDPNFEVYDQSDGLTGSEFNQHAYLKHSSGLFLFGAVDGVTVFDPDDLQNFGSPPKIALTEFYLFNTPVPINQKSEDYGFTLDKCINETHSIRLKHNQNSLAFRFAALNYTPSERYEYVYQMVGIDQDWIDPGERRFISYPKVSPGDYVFNVKPVVIEDGQQVEVKSVQITVLPPPWKTWWAYSLYTLIAISLFVGLLWLQAERSRAIESARAAERDMFRKKMSQDFHDEAGNKITLLSLLTDRARRKSESPEEVKNIAGELQNQIQELRNGMRDFIWVMDPSRDTAFDAVLRLRDFTQQMCEQGELMFEEKGQKDFLRSIPMSGNERRHFLLIFKESVNNAIKYAKASHIQMHVHEGEKPMEMIVQMIDDGTGFDTTQERSGHGLRNMQSRAAQIGGLLEIISSPGEGTRIQLKWSTKT